MEEQAYKSVTFDNDCIQDTVKKIVQNTIPSALKPNHFYPLDQKVVFYFENDILKTVFPIIPTEIYPALPIFFESWKVRYIFDSERPFFLELYNKEKEKADKKAVKNTVYDFLNRQPTPLYISYKPSPFAPCVSYYFIRATEDFELWSLFFNDSVKIHSGDLMVNANNAILLTDVPEQLYKQTILKLSEDESDNRECERDEVATWLENELLTLIQS